MPSSLTIYGIVVLAAAVALMAASATAFLREPTVLPRQRARSNRSGEGKVANK